MLAMSHAQGANEPAVRDITLGDLLQWAAETTPDRIALIAGIPDKANRRQWTYAELYAQALRTARALRARFEPGERVALGRRRGGRRIPRLPDAGDGAGAQAPLPGIAGNHLLQSMGGVFGRRRPCQP